MVIERSKIYENEMTITQFSKLSNHIKNICGINLSGDKKTMVESRLRKRIKLLEFNSFRDYINYVLSFEGQKEETRILIDLISTNKTDFFREEQHFQVLQNDLLPTLFGKGIGRDNKLRIWCAASSSGEEPYTIAFYLNEFQTANPSFNFEFISSDISTRVLKKAALAVYEKEKIDPIPAVFKRKYLLKGKNNQQGLYRIVPEIRKLVKFFRQNLIHDSYNIEDIQDIIFCRNVLIYFDNPTKEKIVNTMCKYLNKGGYLLLGHAESLNGIKAPLERIQSTIYRKL
ncbi:MAG: hypothetical protein JEY94_06150 [Melioribacteraceae bacterium]|nr:hypothetical protein [Melioribacteraceae bacterium]